MNFKRLTVAKSVSRLTAAVVLLAAAPLLVSAQEFASASVVRPPAVVVEKTVTVYGAKIYYQEAGTGPVVILLHGLSGDTSNWAATIGPLSEKYRVIALDQIGFGRSDKPFINYRIGTYVDFLAGFLKELKIDRAALVGNSMGGWISAAFALAYPDKVDRIVLVDAAGYSFPKDDPRVKAVPLLNISTREGLRQVIPLVFYNKQLYGNDATIDLLFAKKIATNDGYTVERIIESYTRGEDVLDNRLSGIKQPTLVVWGREDGLVPLEIGQRFNKEISGSEMVIIEKCGHVPQIEKAAEFNAALMKFLGASVASR